ncbi:hypothetical protein [Streptomyces albus]|uniref:hypothetical protein n=1 Tax=Streptomyces albus TaxID=1888 RepID=UPI0004C93407|nr:hypothetical protein [Streptomyces albus]
MSGADLRLRDLKNGGAVVAEVPLAKPLDTRLTGHRVISAGDFWYRELDLRGDRVAGRLCAVVGRDFTTAERALLPTGAPRTMPADCRQQRDG